MADITITLTDEEVFIVEEALDDYASWAIKSEVEKTRNILEKIRREKENTHAGEADEQEKR